MVKKQEVTQDADRWVLRVDDMAELLSVGRRQVYKFRDAGMPQLSRGKYHAPTCIRWFIDRDKESKARDINEQKQMLYAAQTEKHELDNQVKRGELLEFEAVQTAVFSIGTLVSTQIQAIEPRLARQFTPEQLEALRGELTACLETIAHEIEAFADIRDASRDHPAAA